VNGSTVPIFNVNAQFVPAARAVDAVAAAAAATAATATTADARVTLFDLSTPNLLVERCRPRMLQP
jgi:hypothetical protein